MAKQGVTHVFIGAPIISSLSDGAEEQLSKGHTPVWRERHYVFNEQILHTSSKCRSTQLMEYQGAHSESIVDGTPKQQVSSKNTTLKEDDCDSELPAFLSAIHTCEGEREKEDTQSARGISNLVSSSQHCQIDPTSLGHSGDIHSILQESLSQYLDASFPKKAQPPLAVRTQSNDLELSTDTEFLTVLTSSQVAVLDHKEIYEQVVSFVQMDTNNEVPKNNVAVDDVFQQDAHDDAASSLELFTPTSDDVPTNQTPCFKQAMECSENAVGLLELSSMCAEELQNKNLTEPQSSPDDNFTTATSKRTRVCDNAATSTHLLLEKQQRSKKAKQSNSLVDPDSKKSQERKQMFLRSSKASVLLKHCLDKTKKYNVLVTVVHPCHIKEVQVKTGPNAGSSVPLATIVVLDQSEVERKVVLWRAAAFWTLAVFPGDIIMLTDVTVYEDSWYEETLLQSTARSRLLNLGSCSTLCSQERSNMADCAVLQELLEHISAKHCYLRDLPPRQPQKLDRIPYVRLDQLQQDTLVHLILKVSCISILTECTYHYKGQRQKKVILTVEEAKEHTGTLVLWGTGTSWCDQIRRRRDHVWDFRNLFARRNSISGDIELHTTPWSSCECLFDDDRRAVDFKERYHRNDGPPTKEMDIQTLLEEKCSGQIQVKAHITELEFPNAGCQNQRILLDQGTTLSDILASLPAIVYSGCGKCRRELKTDGNQVYDQCLPCLPFNQVKMFYSLFQGCDLWDGCSRSVPLTFGRHRRVLPAENKKPLCA
ncbi:shieldin complex subunit 2-like isoform X2 [Ascaphus truei]|uniref:shieldin complex subunit 2-like isoform X2 n=1 Tax=Ascaphus truei TaxID=8439 RepID=UPI003F59285A